MDDWAKHSVELTDLGVELTSAVRSEDSRTLADLLRLGASRPVHGVPQGTLIARLVLDDASALRIGYLLPELDRELRRAAGLIRGPRVAFDLASERLGDEVRAMPLHLSSRQSMRPHPLPGKALVLISARRLSPLDVLLEVVEEIKRWLLSDPVQLIITLSWLWAHRPGRSAKTPHPPVAELVKETNKTVREAIREKVPLRVRWHANRDGTLVPDFDVIPDGDSGDEPGD